MVLNDHIFFIGGEIVALSELTKNKIKTLISDTMEGIIKAKTKTHPFSETEIRERNPFGYRLVPIEVWKGSAFERSFVTKLGQTIFEKIAFFVAEGSGAAAVANQHSEDVTINTFRVEKINEILSLQRNSKLKPDWNREIEEILTLKNPRYETVKVISDFYIKRANGVEEYYSFKTVKPNLDQTEIAKRSMLFLTAAKPECEAYFGLPYNPAGEGNSYRRAKHTYPFKLFQMDDDPCVLIGSKLWNKIGDDKNTYDELLDLFEEVGSYYTDIIKRDYLGIKE